MPLGSALRIDNSMPERAAESRKYNPQVAQPPARAPRETGRTALSLARKLILIASRTPGESAPLIGYLCAQAEHPQSG